jgi:hypothetical protein
VKIAGVETVLAFRRQPLGGGKVYFFQSAAIELEERVVTLCHPRTISPARPVATHGIQELPGGFCLGPLAELCLVAKEEQSA